MNNEEEKSFKYDKHITVTKEEMELARQIIRDKKAKTLSGVIHYLFEMYKQNNAFEEVQTSLTELQTLTNKVDKISKKLSDMGLEQSTMSEYLSDYLYLEHYNGSAVNINYGTETAGYRNAKKLAKKRMENNQKGATHRKFHKESIRNETERIEQKRKEMFSKPSNKTSGTGMFKNDFLED